MSPTFTDPTTALFVRLAEHPERIAEFPERSTVVAASDPHLNDAAALAQERGEHLVVVQHDLACLIIEPGRYAVAA